MLKALDNYEWKNERLHYEGRTTGMGILVHPTYPKMYYVRWPDGSLSEDFYNRTRAKEHARLAV